MKKKGLNMEQKRNLTGWAFLLPATILIFVFCFYPMVQALILSFQKGMGSAVQPAGFCQLRAHFKGCHVPAVPV